MSDDSRPPTVIYVMGAGHSGSSILGVTLGNCARVFYAGEVEEWLVRSSAARWGGAERTRFWEQVRERMGDAAEGLFGDRANRAIERSSALLRLDLWPTRLRLARRYRRVAAALFAAIADTAQASFVVDTSHFPLRARQLQRTRGLPLYLVLLVRDPQAVVESHVRALSQHEVAERRLQILSTNLDLWLTQLLSVYVFLRQPRARRMFLRHEDFLADPSGTLAEILAGAGVEGELPDLSALSVGVPIEGNKMLVNETVSLRVSHEQVRRWSMLTFLLQWPWRPVLRRLSPAARAQPAPVASVAESTTHARV
ncbi:MAG TPA: sulfotransferase [Solirubrobacteraceae bacterium]|jgi:hypothetical protein|nr:sulfotransferase [Solirubrobacteraceae bacterium]